MTTTMSWIYVFYTVVCYIRLPRFLNCPTRLIVSTSPPLLVIPYKQVLFFLYTLSFGVFKYLICCRLRCDSELLVGVNCTFWFLLNINHLGTVCFCVDDTPDVWWRAHVNLRIWYMGLDCLNVLNDQMYGFLWLDSVDYPRLFCLNPCCVGTWLPKLLD